MSPFYIVLIIILGAFSLIMIVVFRIYYLNHAGDKEKVKLSGKSKDDPEEVNRRERFRHFIRNFLVKY